MKEFLTIREKIYLLLKKENDYLTIEEIGDYLGVPIHERKRLYDDIYHLMQSVRRRSKGKEKIVMLPPQCINCGYIFKDRNKTKRPSKCPKCGSNRIKGPWFKLIVKK